MVPIYTSPLTSLSTLTQHYSDFELHFLDTTLQGLPDLKQAQKIHFLPNSILFIEPFLNQSLPLASLEDFAKTHQLTLEYNEAQSIEMDTHLNEALQSFESIKGVHAINFKKESVALFLAPHYFCVKQDVLESIQEPRITSLAHHDYLYFDSKYRTVLEKSHLFGVHECVKSLILIDYQNLNEEACLELTTKLLKALQHYAYRGCTF